MERPFRPSAEYRTRQLLPEMGQRLQEILGLPAIPATLGETLDLRSWRPRLASPGDLCCEGSRHRVVARGTIRTTRCVMDALILASVEGEGSRVESVSPLLGERVTVRMGPGGTAWVGPPTALFSYGVGRSGSQVFEALCPYILAFAMPEEYRQWASQTPGAFTLLLSPEEALALAQDLANLLGWQVGEPGQGVDTSG